MNIHNRLEKIERNQQVRGLEAERERGRKERELMELTALASLVAALQPEARRELDAALCKGRGFEHEMAVSVRAVGVDVARLSDDELLTTIGVGSKEEYEEAMDELACSLITKLREVKA